MLYYFSNEQGYPPIEPFKLKRSLIDLYSFVYDHCTSKPAFEEKMLDIYKAALKRHLLQHMSQLKHRSKFIAVYNLICESYTAFARMLSKKVFVYLVSIFI